MSQSTASLGSDGKVTTNTTSQSVQVTSTTSPQKPQKPEHVPDKFWNAEKGEVNYEAWAKSTRELEARFTQQQQQQSQQQKADQSQRNTSDDQQQQTQVSQTQAFKDAAEKARAEFAETGKLSDETYRALENAGVSRAQVDMYIEGVRAKEAAAWAEVFAITGDRAGFDAAAQWALANLSEAEQDDLNARLGNPKTLRGAVSELWSKYQDSLGSDGKKSTGSAPNATNGVEPYRSKQEMMDAVRSDQYKNSEEFRRQHGLRILASERAGINIWI